MRETADERMYADLVRVVREQRRRRDLGYVEPGPSAEEPGGGTEQDTRRA